MSNPALPLLVIVDKEDEALELAEKYEYALNPIDDPVLILSLLVPLVPKLSKHMVILFAQLGIPVKSIDVLPFKLASTTLNLANGCDSLAGVTAPSASLAVDMERSSNFDDETDRSVRLAPLNVPAIDRLPEASRFIKLIIDSAAPAATDAAPYHWCERPVMEYMPAVPVELATQPEV